MTVRLDPDLASRFFDDPLEFLPFLPRDPLLQGHPVHEIYFGCEPEIDQDGVHDLELGAAATRRFEDDVDFTGGAHAGKDGELRLINFLGGFQGDRHHPYKGSDHHHRPGDQEDVARHRPDDFTQSALSHHL